jgi:hypothetical protein
MPSPRAGFVVAVAVQKHQVAPWISPRTDMVQATRRVCSITSACELQAFDSSPAHDSPPQQPVDLRQPGAPSELHTQPHPRLWRLVCRRLLPPCPAQPVDFHAGLW